MFQNSIISDNLTIYKFFKQLNFDLYLTKPQLNHLEVIMSAMISKGYGGKVSDVAELASQRPQNKHYTISIKQFLGRKALNKSLRTFVVELIWKRSKETNKPIYFIVDDTISEKTKPSSKAVKIIEKCSFHYSHLKGKNVYGHQILVSLLSCDRLVLPYSIDIYDKESTSKIELTKNLIASLPQPENNGYVLCDSWYSSKAIFNSSEKAGYSYIGALKTNRIIYPEGHERLGIKLHKFAVSLGIKDFDLVTVEGNEYYAYRYTGDLKDRKNVTIILSYPKEAFHKDGALKAFIALDNSLTTSDILTQYTGRWGIMRISA